MSRNAGAETREARVGPRAKASQVGLRFEPSLSFADWAAYAKALGVRSSASSWWIGDWICFGRAKYGRTYKFALAATGLDYQTLRNYASVARRFELSRRRDNLTFQHHAVVSSLTNEQQDHWLTLAVNHQWSRNDLRREARLGYPGKPCPPVRGHDRSTPPAPVKLSLPAAVLARWQREADEAGVTLEAWIIWMVELILSPHPRLDEKPQNTARVRDPPLPHGPAAVYPWAIYEPPRHSRRQKIPASRATSPERAVSAQM